MPARLLRSSLVSLVLVALVSGCAARSAPSRSTGSTDTAGGFVQEYSPSERVRVTDVRGQVVGGGSFDSRDLDGTVTVVNVWGSWCAPCRSEAPVLAAAAETYGERGVSFLGINVRDNPAAAEAFERTYEIPYPSVDADASPDVLLAFGGTLTTSAVPATLVLDRDRRVAARVVGEISAGTLRTLIEDQLTTEDP